jgi:hypothetical protein
MDTEAGSCFSTSIERGGTESPQATPKGHTDMAYVSRDQDGFALSTPNGDDFLFSRNAPKFTIHNHAGIQVDGYGTKWEANAALIDFRFEAWSDGYPTRFYVVRNQNCIVAKCG